MKAESTKARTTRARKPPAGAPQWTEEQRQRIAELAFQRFAARGGLHGSHVDDWLEAEKEFAAMLAPPRRRRATTAAKS